MVAARCCIGATADTGKMHQCSKDIVVAVLTFLLTRSQRPQKAVQNSGEGRGVKK